MEKLKMHTPNITDANIQKLAELFPNCVTETKDEAGLPIKAIDFDLLKQELANNIVEGSQERYQLNWVGKKEALLTANAPIAKTLRPCKQESVDFDTTQNLYIEGDNLDALKLLQETYLGKVKMIYIDPPYNTGNDFIYEDDFSEDNKAYLYRSNQKDEIGNHLIANTESNGRFHSDWLSMMYSRMKLARNLLCEEGVIFLSIDDNEQANAKRICDEIFGEMNFIGIFTVVSTPNARDYGHIGKTHEYVIFYAKNIEKTQTNQLKVIDKSFRYTDSIGGFNIHPLYNSNEAFTNLNRPNLFFPIYLNPNKKVDDVFYHISFEKTPESIEIFPPKSEKNSIQFVWRWGREKCSLNFNKEIIGYRTDKGDYRIVQKMRHTTKLIRSLLDSTEYTSRRGTAEVEDILDGKIASFPKPLGLLKTLIEVGTEGDDIVLDFFSGSSTTAHAVMQLNSEDDGCRKFIMVQIPDACDEESEAFKAGFKTITEIGKERIRRAGNKIKKENPDAVNLDVGFRVFKIDTSNMADVFYNPDAISQDLLSDQVENIKPDRTSEDLLFQVLLDWGVDLTLPITRETLAGKEVFFVAEDALVACFDNDISEDCLKAIAHKKPLRVVFRDSGFSNDSVKINVEQIFKLISPSTEIKTI